MATTNDTAVQHRVEKLMEMGFSEEKCRKAVTETGINANMDTAVNWLLSHIDDVESAPSTGHTLGTKDDQTIEETASTTTDNVAESTTPPTALSLKCDDCGKRFKSELDAQAHAARTKHANFSESTEEIKPLTEEEKKAAIARLEAKRLQKRAEREEMEKKEAKQKEKIRRKTGQEVTMIKHEMEKKEAMKIAEQKKREKLEEKRARERVKEQIAKDRAERAAKEKAEKPQEGQQPSTPPTNTVKKDYDTCRLQIRLFDGKQLVQTFNATDTLVDVNRYILMNRTDENVPYALSTTFPKRVFVGTDSVKTLKDLGLTPASVLVLTRQ